MHLSCDLRRPAAQPPCHHARQPVATVQVGEIVEVASSDDASAHAWLAQVSAASDAHAQARTSSLWPFHPHRADLCILCRLACDSAEQCWIAAHAHTVATRSPVSATPHFVHANSVPRVLLRGCDSDAGRLPVPWGRRAAGGGGAAAAPAIPGRQCEPVEPHPAVPELAAWAGARRRAARLIARCCATALQPVLGCVLLSNSAATGDARGTRRPEQAHCRRRCVRHMQGSLACLGWAKGAGCRRTKFSQLGLYACVHKSGACR